MAAPNPLNWLLGPAALQGLRQALAWAAEQAAEALVEEGAKATARRIAARLRGDPAQKQLRTALEEAIAALRRKERFLEVADALDLNGSFILEEAAKVATFGAEPDLDHILRWSLGLPEEKRVLAREALEFLFAQLRQALYNQSEFQEIWQLWEAQLTREGVERLVQEFSLAREHLADLTQAARDARVGLYVRPAAPLPDPLQVQLYLEEMAAQPVMDLERRELAYVSREARERRHELFPRQVILHRPDRPSSEQLQAKDRSKPVEDVLARQRRLVLLGDPGAGKTITLRHLAREAAEKALAGDGAIPVYIELKRYKGQADLAPLLAQAVDEALAVHWLTLSADPEEAARIVRTWLHQGKFLLLLDGLNEVHPDRRTAAVAALKSLLAGPHQMVVSCRERDYSVELQDLAAAYTLQPLGEEEIRDYLEQDLGKQGEVLFCQIRGDERLFSLAGNPLMLWLMARVAEAEPEGQLPANKGQLLARFTAAMPSLRRREAVLLPDIPDDDVRVALRSLGLAMQERKRLEASLSEARAWTGWSGPHDLALVLRTAKGLRFLKSDGRWGEPVAFLHPLFQEYFAAEALRTKLEEVQDYAAVLGDRPFKGRWDEVLVMLAGIYDDAVGLVNWLAAEAITQQGRAALLVYSCWETGDAVNDVEAREAVVDALSQALGDSERGVRFWAAWALGKIKDPQAVEPLAHALGDTDKLVRRMAVKALGEIGPSAFESLIRALRDQDKWVRRRAVEALGRMGVLAVEPLIGVLDDPDAGVRRRAVEYLGKIKDSQTVEPLIRALRDQDKWVRRLAALALGEIGDPRALPELERVAQEDQNERVAEAARKAAERIRQRMESE